MVTIPKDSLPWLCPDHPDGMIRHTWTLTRYVMNHMPSGLGSASDHRYDCDVEDFYICDERDEDDEQDGCLALLP